MNDKRTYLDFDPAKGYPAAKGLFYECLICGEVVPSLPDDDYAKCKCHNIYIERGYGRMAVSEPERIRLFSED